MAFTTMAFTTTHTSYIFRGAVYTCAVADTIILTKLVTRITTATRST
jgi:hypothetical protein